MDSCCIEGTYGLSFHVGTSVGSGAVWDRGLRVCSGGGGYEKPTETGSAFESERLKIPRQQWLARSNRALGIDLRDCVIAPFLYGGTGARKERPFDCLSILTSVHLHGVPTGHGWRTVS